MIPDFAGQTIDIARIDWGLHFWTSENWEFVLSNPILITVQHNEGVEEHEFDPDVERRPVRGVAGGGRQEMFICSPSGELMDFLPFPDPPDGATTD